jgi:hypothetical protein
VSEFGKYSAELKGLARSGQISMLEADDATAAARGAGLAQLRSWRGYLRSNYPAAEGLLGTLARYDSFRVEPPLRRRPAQRDELAVELAGELRDLWPTCVPGFLKDRRDLGVRDEVLPALRIPVEEHPDPALLIGIAKGV